MENLLSFIKKESKKDERKLILFSNSIFLGQHVTLQFSYWQKKEEKKIAFTEKSFTIATLLAIITILNPWAFDTKTFTWWPPTACRMRFLTL